VGEREEKTLTPALSLGEREEDGRGRKRKTPSVCEAQTPPPEARGRRKNGAPQLQSPKVEPWGGGRMGA